MVWFGNSFETLFSTCLGRMVTIKIIDKVKNFNFNLGLQINTILHTAFCYSLERKPVKALKCFRKTIIYPIFNRKQTFPPFRVSTEQPNDSQNGPKHNITNKKWHELMRKVNVDGIQCQESSVVCYGLFIEGLVPGYTQHAYQQSCRPCGGTDNSRLTTIQS